MKFEHKNSNILIRVNQEKHQKLKDLAVKEKRSISDLIRYAIKKVFGIEI